MAPKCSNVPAAAGPAARREPATKFKCNISASCKILQEKEQHYIPRCDAVRSGGTYGIHLQGLRCSMQATIKEQVGCLLRISSTLKIEAVPSSELSANFYHTTRCHILEDDRPHLHSHRYQNLKSNICGNRPKMTGQLMIAQSRPVQRGARDILSWRPNLLPALILIRILRRQYFWITMFQLQRSKMSVTQLNDWYKLF
jgi:hypothetical protein